MSLASSSPFPKARPAKPPTREITQKELEEIKYAFELFDKDKKGWIYPRELKIALRALDFPVKKAEVGNMLAQATASDDVQQVDYKTFESVMAHKITGRKPEDQYKRAFRMLDVDNIGAIHLRSLKAVVQQLPHLQIDDVELREMITEFDYDRDGVINEAEFLAIMQEYDF